MERLGDAEMGRNISVDRAPRTSLHLLCCLVAHFHKEWGLVYVKGRRFLVGRGNIAVEQWVHRTVHGQIRASSLSLAF